jgi:hypothetical protein
MVDVIRNESAFRRLKTLLPLAFKLVFAKPIYFVIAAAVFTTFWIIFNLFDQLLFFSPVLSFHLPADAVVGFVLTNVISVLMGILISMNVYLIGNSKMNIDKSSLLSGSILSIVSSSCVGCSSVGFVIISTLGSVGVLATDFLTNYQISLRIASIVVLVWALYSVHKKVTKTCSLAYK